MSGMLVGEVGRQQRIQDHVLAPPADRLPTAQQALPAEAASFRGTDGRLVPRLDMKLKARDSQFAERPPGDGDNRVAGGPSSPRRARHPIPHLGSYLAAVQQPQPDLADRLIRGRLGNSEPVAGSLLRPAPLALDEPAPLA